MFLRKVASEALTFREEPATEAWSCRFLRILELSHGLALLGSAFVSRGIIRNFECFRDSGVDGGERGESGGAGGLAGRGQGGASEAFDLEGEVGRGWERAAGEHGALASPFLEIILTHFY